MINLLFGVTYLGTNYAGWQKQDNALGIQEIIENALTELCQTPIEIFASGRTDAGVHAIEQTFSCKLNFANYQKLPIALNSKLPDDIRILWVKQVDPNFHARYSAHKKTYVYRIKTNSIPSPFDQHYTTYLNQNLNIDQMQEAANLFIGEHNFKAFCSSGTSVPSFERTIYSFNITKTNNLYEFEICGNGFLYNMVRIIVGTIVEVGSGKISVDSISQIIKNQNRALAGKTMPAKALILKSVEY